MHYSQQTDNTVKMHIISEVTKALYLLKQSIQLICFDIDRGTVYACGDNKMGQCGTGNTSQMIEKPTRVRIAYVLSKLSSNSLNFEETVNFNF